MRHATSRALYAYWNELRRDRIAPQRLEIQPARIADHLPDTFILERSEARDFRFRLAGTRICNRFGMELRGINFLAQWTPGDRDLLEHHFAEMTNTGRAGVFTLEAAPVARAHQTFEIVVLPLVHTGRAIDRMLCAFLPLEEIPWHSDERIAHLRLLAAESIWPPVADRDAPVTATLAERERDLADRQAPLAAHVRSARIVRSDRRQFRVYEGGLADD